MERLPMTLLVDCGLNVTLQVALCPPTKVTGYFRPLRAKPVPDTVACVTVIFKLPELVRVTACVWLVPTGTALKLIVEGLNVSCPLASAFEERAKIAKKPQRQINPNGMLFFEPRFLTTRPQTPCQSCAAGG